MSCARAGTLVGCIAVLAAGTLLADDTALRAELEELRQQNKAFQNHIRRQEALLEELSRKVAFMETNRTPAVAQTSLPPAEPAPTPVSHPIGDRIRISVEGGVGFFDSTENGAFPNAEFRVDELRLFVEGKAFEDVYGFVELNLATRETSNVNAQLGEAYIDFENISKLWGQERVLNLRLGRLDVPFGEEYLYRDAIDNPLISHSIADFWGIDEGLELYGALAGVTYILALQNGSIETARDLDSDKAVTVRLGFDPVTWLHLGASAIRTGDLDAVAEWSELWIGNGFFRSIGSPGTTHFNAHAVQGDVRVRLPKGHIHLAGGYALYDDNDPLADNRTDLWFYSIEAVHTLVAKLYAGTRFSHMLADDGYPIVGQGEFGNYYFGPFTEELWRLGLGLGYRFSQNLVLKTEYTFERGDWVGGDSRGKTDLFAAQAAFQF